MWDTAGRQRTQRMQRKTELVDLKTQMPQRKTKNKKIILKEIFTVRKNGRWLKKIAAAVMIALIRINSTFNIQNLKL